MLNDVVALTRQFERRRPPLKKRIRKEKKPRIRENKKISAFHMKKIIDLRNHQNLSYSQIGKALTLKPETIYYALKRYNIRGEFVDNRIQNGRNNP